MEQEDFYTEFRKFHPKAHFLFPQISATDAWVFEKLDLENFEQLYLLFENDVSPFVDGRFKTCEGAKEYAKEISFCGAYMPKHGRQDWLFKTPTGEYGGILHLYDLSKETFAKNHKRAWIGFATKTALREQHKTVDVVKHFINYIFNSYPDIDFIHAMTDKQNVVAQKFLIRLGFMNDEVERMSKSDKFYILCRPNLS